MTELSGMGGRNLPDVDYFDHDADIGITGRGKTVEEAFCSVARGLFSIICDESQVEPVHRIEVRFEEEEIGVALVRWLNALLGESKAEGLILSRFHLERRGNDWRGEGWGEAWRSNHERGVEVKGATFTMLSVEKEGEHWKARCVVDV